MKKINFKKQKLVTMLLLILSLHLFFNCGINDPDNNVFNTEYSATENFSFTVDGSNRSQLKVNSINGSIEILGVAGLSSVEISGEKKVDSETRADAQAHLKDLDVNISTSGTEINVETEQPQETYGRDYSVNFQIRVPASWQVKTNLTNGEVYVDSLNNDVDINLINGNVVLNEVFGGVNVVLTNGQVDGRLFLPLHSQFDISTTNGVINLLFPKTTSANFTAQVTNGIIKTNELSFSNMSSSNQLVTGKLGNGQGSIQLKTTNGNINVSGF